jgi:transposase
MPFCRKRAGRTAIELAWLRHQPDSGPARWFHERIGACEGRIHRTMIVALARKLVIVLLRYLTRGLLAARDSDGRLIPPQILVLSG